MDESQRPEVVYLVPEGIHYERADKVLASHFKDVSRNIIQESFDADLVILRGKPIAKRCKVSTGDELHITLLTPKVSKVFPVKMPLDILYEDEYLVAVNKDPGVVVHPGNGTGDDTLVHGLLEYTGGKLSCLGGEQRPGVVHRLDKETTGVIVLAKSDEVYLALIQLFAERKINKEYLALVSKVLQLDSGSIKEAIDRHPVNRTRMHVTPRGRSAHTDWAVEKRYARCTLVRCWPHTGRTHQIRVHLSYMGYPIVGDTTYGYRPIQVDLPKAPRVLLHAEKLVFNHPITGELLSLIAPVAKDFTEYLASLA